MNERTSQTSMTLKVRFTLLVALMMFIMAVAAMDIVGVF